MRTIVYVYAVTATFTGERESYRKMTDFIAWMESALPQVHLATLGQRVLVTADDCTTASEVVDELMENYLDQLVSFEVKRDVQRS